MSTPTSRALEKLRAEGYIACVVEKWVPASPQGFKGRIITRDAFNFGDILAARVGELGALLVQCTTGDNAAARVAKIKSIAEAGIWLAAGNRIEVWAFSKMGKAGARKTWQCRVEKI